MCSRSAVERAWQSPCQGWGCRRAFALHHSLPLRESQASLEGVEVTDQVRKPVVVHVFASGIAKEQALLISSCAKSRGSGINPQGRVERTARGDADANVSTAAFFPPPTSSPSFHPHPPPVHRSPTSVNSTSSV